MTCTSGTNVTISYPLLCITLWLEYGKNNNNNNNAQIFHVRKIYKGTLSSFTITAEFTHTYTHKQTNCVCVCVYCILFYLCVSNCVCVYSKVYFCTEAVEGGRKALIK